MIPSSMMNEPRWYVGYVRNCQEKNVASILSRFSVECYVPVQKERRKWSDRIVLKDRIVLPHMIFVHCTETERRKLFEYTGGYITGFLMDRSRNEPASVPQRQMEDFMRIVSDAPNPVKLPSATKFNVDDRIVISAGPFKGLECIVDSVRNEYYICVRLGVLGTALTQIEASQVMRLD